MKIQKITAILKYNRRPLTGTVTQAGGRWLIEWDDTHAFTFGKREDLTRYLKAFTYSWEGF